MYYTLQYGKQLGHARETLAITLSRCATAGSGQMPADVNDVFITTEQICSQLDPVCPPVQLVTCTFFPLKRRSFSLGDVVDKESGPPA